MSASFTIRQVTATDIDMLQQISIETFCDTYAAFNTEENMKLHVEEKFNKQRLYDEILTKGESFFVAEKEGLPAGYIKLRSSEEPEAMKGRKHIELERIYARKQFQGLGLGKLLIDEALLFAKENGYKVLWLGVWKQNEKAFHFYKRNGFEVFGEQVFMLGSDAQSDWLMKKELT